VALDVDAVPVAGTWWRHAYPGSPALPERDPAPDARWQRGEVVDALYLADDEETAWAEWYRHLAELGLPPNRAMPRDLWRWSIAVDVADLSTVAALERVGLQPPRPGRRTWPAYQGVGEALARDGWAGLLAPSAARPEHLVLCLFRRPGARRITGARAVGRPRRVDEPPAPPTGMTT
jgi:RES domain-containing protein